MSKYSTVIFDLDGTLMDSLKDLSDSVNFVLKKMNLEERSFDEIREFVGNGVGVLMKRALCAAQNGKNQIDEEFLKYALEIFRSYYSEHCKDNTKPYDGILNMLAILKNKNYKMAIVSNKPQKEVSLLNNIYFSDYVSVAIGENELEGIRRKPYPDMVFKAIELLNETKENCVFAGDSDVDFLTAKNAELDCISVLWGFRTEEFLRQKGATVFAHSPEDVLSILS